MTISVLMTYKDILRKCHSDEEAELIKLLRRIESEIINLRPMDARQNLLRLSFAIRKKIQNSRLSQSTRNKVFDVVLIMASNKNVYWMSGFSVDAYFPKTEAGRKVQRRHARMKRKRKIAPLPLEKLYLRRKFNQLCRSAKTGSYEMAYKQYQGFITKYPRYKFDHKEFGKAIYRHARKLSEKYQRKKNLNLLTSLLDAETKALIVFKRALIANPKDSGIYSYIGVLEKELGKREYRKAIEDYLRKNPNNLNLIKLRRELLPFAQIAQKSRSRLKIFLILICGCALGAATWHFRSDLTQLLEKIDLSDQSETDLINKLSPGELRELTDQIKKDPKLETQYMAYLSEFRRSRKIKGEWKAKQLIQCRRDFLKQMANDPKISRLLEKLKNSKKKSKKKRSNHK